jgi:hypothetical protein
MPSSARIKAEFGTRMLSMGKRLLRMTQTPTRSMRFDRFTLPA